ncbi:hypothetical protein PUN4_740013 [Paraburkholderia unamae]|nr:hypothetical protein PUN4_740013 [Paraburkholderia unamae]
MDRCTNPLSVHGLDRGYTTPLQGTDGCHASTRRLAVEMYSARAAQCHATTKFGAGKPKFVSQVPQQRHFAVTVELMLFAIHDNVYHFVCPFQ